MLKVYTAESLVDGNLVLGLLQQQGIAARLFHDHAQGGLGELPLTYPEIWIRRTADFDLARRVIERFETQQIDLPPLRCPYCREHNPVTFEICWQCYGNLSDRDRSA